MEKITIKTGNLLLKLKKNRAQYKTEYIEAEKGY